MYGIVWRYLPRGSWRMDERIFENKEKAEAVAESHNNPDNDVRAKAIYLGDSADWS